jgi:hypothetical protein
MNRFIALAGYLASPGGGSGGVKPDHSTTGIVIGIVFGVLVVIVAVVTVVRSRR